MGEGGAGKRLQSASSLNTLCNPLMTSSPYLALFVLQLVYVEYNCSSDSGSADKRSNSLSTHATKIEAKNWEISSYVVVLKNGDAVACWSVALVLVGVHSNGRLGRFLFGSGAVEVAL